MSDLVTRVELSFACVGLKNLDVLSKSDAQIIVYMRDMRSQVHITLHF
jgi:hypothetical protein